MIREEIVARSRSTVEVIPSARRLIHSLRDVGYDFVHAVADLIDNSIAAKASQVAIDMRFEGEDSWVRIVDNGTGMSGSTITEAMRFGTERDYAPDDLGKFGLGMKTASLSQCSRFTVASRIDRSACRIEARQWDLAHVEATNRWEVFNVPVSERPDVLTEPLQSHRGTVVLWELLDRMLGYKIPWGDRARSGFYQMAEQLDGHLGMVFHRFLSGEARRKKKLKITVNGTTVDPWDPFARAEKACIRFATKQFEVHADDGRGLVGYTAYVLPHQDRFSSLRAFNHYAGPAKWNYQQGFYIYRADRMIQSGGWSYMRTSDEHTKLARVAIDFLPDLDSAFELNVSKARVNLPADLRAHLKRHIEELVKQARKAYSGGSKTTRRQAGGAGIGSTSGAGPTSGREEKGAVGPDPVGTGERDTGTSGHAGGGSSHIGRAIESAAAKAGETPALNRIRRTLKRNNPEIADGIGW